MPAPEPYWLPRQIIGHGLVGSGQGYSGLMFSVHTSAWAGIEFKSCDATVIPAVEAMVEACRFDPWITQGKGRSYTFSTETFHAAP